MATTDELIAATHQAIADTTAFEKQDINRKLASDDEAYDKVKRNLGRSIAGDTLRRGETGSGAIDRRGHLRLTMPLALQRMKRGSYQVEMSDEALIGGDIENALSVVIEAVAKVELPADEVLA